MKNEIIEKLALFLKKHSLFTEECHVIYFLVEVRKLLEQYNFQNSYKILRFYCNWALHSRIDQTRPFEDIVQSLENDRIEKSKTDTHELPTMNDLSIKIELMIEIGRFLEEVNLPTDLYNKQKQFLAFEMMLTSILADQPIVFKTGVVKKISFERTNNSEIWLVVEFRDDHKNGRIFRQRCNI